MKSLGVVFLGEIFVRLCLQQSKHNQNITKQITIDNKIAQIIARF